MFNCHLSKDAGVSQRVPSRLRIHAKPVRALSDWNFSDEMAVTGIDRVDFGVVSAGKPEHFAVGGDAAHVRASAAGQLPFLDDALALEVDERDRSFIAIRNIEDLGIPAHVQAMGAIAGTYEPDLLHLISVDEVNSIGMHVGDVDNFPVRCNFYVLASSVRAKLQSSDLL